MIGYIEGKLLSISENEVLLNVNGIGYLIIDYANKVIFKNEMRSYYIYQKVSQDVNELYGFTQYEAISLVKLFLKINGVGIKQTAKIISSYSDCLELVKDILDNDSSKIYTTVKVVGKKTIEKIINNTIEVLRKRYPQFYVGSDGAKMKINEENNYLKELEVLGFSKESINEAMTILETRKYEEVLSIEELIKEIIIIINENNHG